MSHPRDSSAFRDLVPWGMTSPNRGAAELSRYHNERMKLILAGEPSYDILVRWKPLHQPAIGWHPDLNDGVRVNIRPFIEAGILRKTPNIKWGKDRGKEPQRDKDEYPWFWSGKEFTGDRVNDVHLTNAAKGAAQRNVERSARKEKSVDRA